ncbi:hypothetical protein ABDK00_017050 [Niabella insulamsoli]|uniref:hypothetical protein n=1 Tax=Niabella insulamsoli TaxID=3144874 RepID=UPI0031FCA402
MRKFQIKDIKGDALDGLHKLIDDILNEVSPLDDYEALLFANLRSLQTKLYAKLAPHKWQNKYTFHIPPEEALALRIFYTRYIDDTSTSLHIMLERIAYNVHQIFELPTPKK